LKSPEMKERMDEVGFIYYLILARLYDIDPHLNKNDGEAELSLKSLIWS
jgi:hypothetical protein